MRFAGKVWPWLPLVGALVLAVAGGLQLANRREPGLSPSLAAVAKVLTQPAQESAQAEEATLQPSIAVTVASLRASWSQAKSFEEIDRVAASLAEINTAESVAMLMEGIRHTQEWSQRAALAKNLRAVSDPETLAVLVPALLENYGRGSTILGEIVDVIARLAQPETIEDLAALHWQASMQAGQGHKVLRAVAAIRNPAATRGLARIAERSDSPALAAAAQEALKALLAKTGDQATAQ